MKQRFYEATFLLQGIAGQADGQPLPVDVIHHVAAHDIRQVFLLCLEPPLAAAPFRDEEISGLMGALNQILPVARDPLIDLSLYVSHGTLLFSIRSLDDPLGQGSVILKMGEDGSARKAFRSKLRAMHVQGTFDPADMHHRDPAEVAAALRLSPASPSDPSACETIYAYHRR
jgi:hypothetical protein